MLVALLVGGCSAGQGPEAVGPLFSHLFGPAYEGREAPPGTEGEFPNLGTVPPRPTVPNPEVRAALTAALAEERQRSRNPFDPELRPSPPRPSGTAGDRSLPQQAPPRPSLASAPRIPWDSPAPPPTAAPAAVPAPSAPSGPTPAGRPSPAAAPAPPDIGTAPPPPPPADLLAPGAGPPPPPPAELLAPRTRTR